VVFRPPALSCSDRAGLSGYSYILQVRSGASMRRGAHAGAVFVLIRIARSPYAGAGY